MRIAFLSDSQMEKDLEEKLRAKYTLVDKTDPAAIAAAQQVGVSLEPCGNSCVSGSSGDFKE